MNKQSLKTIRWGIIGLGEIAAKFANDLQGVAGAELYAVASRSQQKADQFCKKYPAKKAYSSYVELANDSEIDAIYIATPHALHCQHSLLCLRQGKAVLCEKPLAMNSEQVQLMLDCAKQHRVLLMEALWTYFLPHYRFVLEALQLQRYGKLLNVSADFGFNRQFNNDSRLFNKALGGGSLLDIGIYPIFAALSTLGKPDAISAQATYFANGVDSSCTMKFCYNNQAQATLTSSLIADTSCEAIFACQNGTITINKGFHGPATVTIITATDVQTLDFNYSAQSHGYRYEIEHFNELLHQGKTESNIMSFAFSETLMATLDKVRALIDLQYD